MLDEVSNNCFQFAFHNGRHIRTRNEKVLEICGRKNQHLASTVDAEEIVANARLCHLGPILKVGELPFRLLRKEVVCKPEGKFSISMQFVYNTVIVGIVLKTSPGINNTGDSKAVQFAKEMPGRVDLILTRKLRPLG